MTPAASFQSRAFVDKYKLSLPSDILKKFNSRVDGFSTGLGPALPGNREKYGFNVAVPGARAE